MTSRQITLLVFAAAVLAQPVGVLAQPSRPLSPETPVRVTLPDSRFVGKVAVVGSDSLSVWTDGKRTVRSVAFEDIEHLEVKEWGGGRLSTRGLMIGFGVGAALGAAIGYSLGDDTQPCFICFTAGDKAVMGAGALGLVGGGLGALIGHASKRYEWLTVPVSEIDMALRLSPGPRGAAVLTASIQF